jgi:argonaute-like protein implicated in RNA metabolism and viral defense
VSPYWVAKAKLTEQGIPSQMMMVENVEDDYDLKYAIVNTVCQIYAKLGGKPWGVEETGYAADLVVGIGRSYYQPEKHGPVDRTLGFAAAYQSNGTFFWFDSETSGGDISELESKLTDTICSVVDQYVKREQSPRRIIIHTPERIGDTERSARRRIEEEYDNTEVVLLHLNTTHPYKTHDPDHTSGLPEPGWFLQAGGNKGLVVTDGRKQFRNGSASPIAMTVEGLDNISRDDLVGLAQNTFSLCSAYWKDQMGAGTPITLRYAEDIADMFEASQYLAQEQVVSLNPDQLVNDRLQDRPWFL